MRGTQKGDVYSFGIILYEIFGRDGPYGKTVFQEEDIVALVRDPEPGKDFYRPDIEALKDTDLDYKAEDYILGMVSKLIRFVICAPSLLCSFCFILKKLCTITRSVQTNAGF